MNLSNEYSYMRCLCDFLTRFCHIIVYIFVGAIALSVPFLLIYQYPSNDCWNGLGGFGNYLTGLAALFAAVKAVPEWIRFKRNKQREKVEEALVAAKRFINAIFHVSNPFSTSQKAIDPENKTKGIILERQERMKVVLKDAQKLFEISSEADLYLDDNKIDLVDRLIEIWNEVQSNFNMYIFNLNNNVMGPDAVNAWEKAFVQGALKSFRLCKGK